MGNLTEHYDTSELECRCGCGLGADPADYDSDWIAVLSLRRRILDRPSVITSGFRCPLHNAAVGGVDDSAHLRGAIDERVTSGRSRWEAVLASVLAFCVDEGELGIGDAHRIYNKLRSSAGGIGIAKTFVHVDYDTKKPRPSCWSY
jgi:hypothetical protein